MDTVVEERSDNQHEAQAKQTAEAEAHINQLLAQLQRLGVVFGAVAIAPKSGTQVPLVEFLPEGWKFQVVPMMKNGNGNNSLSS